MDRPDNSQQQTDERGIVLRGAVNSEVGFPAAQFWTGFDLSTEAGKRLFLQAKNGESLSFEDSIGQELNLANFVLHEVSEVDGETGELKTWYRQVLVDKDGIRYAGGSSGIRNSIAEFISLWGRPPWIPPIKCRIVAIRTRNKRTVHKLEVI